MTLLTIEISFEVNCLLNQYWTKLMYVYLKNLHLYHSTKKTTI